MNEEDESCIIMPQQVVETAFRLGNLLSPLGAFHDIIRHGLADQNMDPEVIAKPETQALYRAFAEAASNWIGSH